MKDVTSNAPDICIEACKRYACQIQMCLERFGQQEKYCDEAIARWITCCEEVKEQKATAVKEK